MNAPQSGFRSFRFWVSVAVAALLSGCGQETPVRVGFVAGLTGRVADLGQPAFKGATLAVDDWNAGGKRKVELLTGDDRQDPAAAAEAVKALLDQNVACVIGHMTSAMSLVGTKIANERKIPLISPTTTTTDLTGIDDYFFRVISSTRTYSGKMAAFLADKKSLRKVALVYDLNNKSYTETWCDNFAAEFKKRGGEVIFRKTYSAGASVQFGELAKEVLAAKPEAVVLAMSAMDAAMFCQQVRKLDTSVILATSEWPATEKLIELGGKAVEGIFSNQYFFRDDQSPRYVAFRNHYRERFHEEPGFAAVSAYDAMTVALKSLAEQKKGESLKEAILRVREFEGLQGNFVIDPFGDTERNSVIVTVAGGAFKIVQ